MGGGDVETLCGKHIPGRAPNVGNLIGTEGYSTVAATFIEQWRCPTKSAAAVHPPGPRRIYDSIVACNARDRSWPFLAFTD